MTISDRTRAFLAKADEDLGIAQSVLPISAAQAARLGYMAALHAARALIFERTGGSPKTHSGTRSRFFEIAKEDERLGAKFGRFFALAYEQKDMADYRTDASVEPEDAVKTIEAASALVATIKMILEAD